MRTILQYDMPCTAKNAAGQATDATMTDSLVNGEWQTTIARKNTTDKITIVAPFTGTLHVETVGTIEWFVIDAEPFVRLARDLSRDLLTPQPMRVAITGQQFAGFAPVKLSKTYAKKNGVSNAAAAQTILQWLRTPPPQTEPVRQIAVVVGDPIGTLDPNTPTTLRFELVDRSSVPLEFAYRYMRYTNPRLLAYAAQGWVDKLKSSASRRFGPFLDFLIPDDAADPFMALQVPPKTGTFTATFDPAGTSSTVNIAPGMRRYVVPDVQGATGVTVRIALGGVPVPVVVDFNGGPAGLATDWTIDLTSPATAPNTQAADDPLRLALSAAGPAVRVTAPATIAMPTRGSTTVNLLVSLVSGTAPQTIKFEGASATGTQITATQGSSSVSAPVTAYHWKVEVSINPAGGAQEITFADDASESTKVTVVPVALTLARPSTATGLPTPISAAVTAHDQTGDRRDSLELGAKIDDAGALTAALGAGTYTTEWSIDIDTAIPWRHYDPALEPTKHWVWVRASASSGGTNPPLATPWDPPPLTVTITSRKGYSASDDQARIGLNMLGAGPGDTPGRWSGNINAQAGPIAGTALLSATVRKGSVVLYKLPQQKVTVAGYEGWSLGWDAFYEQVTVSLAEFFPTGGWLRNRLGLSDDELTQLMLAVIAWESSFNHFFLGSPPSALDADPPPPAANIKGMPYMPNAYADTGFGMISSPTFAQSFDWRSNLRRSAEILSLVGRRPGVATVPLSILLWERGRLLGTVPANEKDTARNAVKGKLDDYVAAMTALPGAGATSNPKLLSAMITLYNGWSEPEYISNLQWDSAQADWVDAGNMNGFTIDGTVAKRNNVSGTYVGRIRDLRLPQVKVTLMPPRTNKKTGQTIRFVRDFAGSL